MVFSRVNCVFLFQLYFLLWAFYLFDSGNSSSTGRKSGFLPHLRPPKKVKVMETIQPAAAMLIYAEYGVGNKDNVCKSADKKTRYIKGYSLCKKASKNLRELMPNEESKIIDAKCWTILMRKGDYKYKEKTDSRRSKYDFHDEYKQVMVSCIASDNTKKLPYKKESAVFNLLHARDDYYYIFEGRRQTFDYPKVLRCLLLKFDKNDYPVITVKDTTEKFEMDDIFGHHGVMKNKEDVNHVCHVVENTNILVGQRLCEPALKKLRLGSKHLKDVPSSCVTEDIYRVNPPDLSSGWPLVSKITGITCWYNGKNNEREYILIANTPVENFYYIAAPRYNTYTGDYRLCNQLIGIKMIVFPSCPTLP